MTPMSRFGLSDENESQEEYPSLRKMASNHGRSDSQQGNHPVQQPQYTGHSSPYQYPPQPQQQQQHQVPSSASYFSVPSQASMGFSSLQVQPFQTSSMHPMSYSIAPSYPSSMYTSMYQPTYNPQLQSTTFAPAVQSPTALSPAVSPHDLRAAARIPQYAQSSGMYALSSPFATETPSQRMTQIPSPVLPTIPAPAKLIIDQQPVAGAVPKKPRNSNLKQKPEERKILSPPPVIRLDLSADQEHGHHRCQSPFMIAKATLVKHDSDEPVSMPGDYESPLSGATTSGLYCCKYLPDQPGQVLPFFVFNDLTVRLQGEFRLRIDAFEMNLSNQSLQVLDTVYTTIFTVCAYNKFNIPPDTTINQNLNNQGVKVKLSRKKTLAGKKRRRSQDDEDDDAEEQASQDLNEAQSTPEQVIEDNVLAYRNVRPRLEVDHSEDHSFVDPAITSSALLGTNLTITADTSFPTMPAAWTQSTTYDSSPWAPISRGFTGVSAYPDPTSGLPTSIENPDFSDPDQIENLTWGGGALFDPSVYDTSGPPHIDRRQ